MKTLVYSMLLATPDAPETWPDLISMYELWWRHWRGPGGYAGDLMLFTNMPDLARPSVQIRPLKHLTTEVKDVFYARVLNYQIVPFSRYDLIMQTDLDVLAINHVAPLFQLSSPFQAAASGLNLYDPRHIGSLRCFPMDAWQRFLPSKRTRQGISASAFACAGTDWIRCMSHWAKLVDCYRHRPLHLDDQTLLNLAYARQSLPIASYPPSYIRHHNWANHPDAILWHFPTLNRLEVMRQHQHL